MEIQTAVAVKDSDAVTLQILIVGLALLIAQTLALILGVVLEEHLVGIKVAMGHDGHLRLGIADWHLQGQLLGSSAAIIILRLIDLLITIAAIVHLILMGLVEIDHSLLTVKTDAAIVEIIIQLFIGNAHPSVGMNVIGGNGDIKREVFTIGIIPKQTERIARTCLNSCTAATNDRTIIEDGLHQVFLTFILAVIDGYGITHMRIVFILDRLSGKKLFALIGILRDDQVIHLLFLCLALETLRHSGSKLS